MYKEGTILALYWPWENVSPVRRLKDEYNELIDDLDYHIRRIEGNIKNISSSIDDLHKILKNYSTAKGIMADLYYKKIEESESNYKNILASCQEALSEVKKKRRRAIEIRDNLQYYYQLELRDDIEFSLGEISL